MISFFMSFPLKVNLRSPLATTPIRWHEILKRETFSWSFSSSWRCHLEMLKHYQRRDFIKYLTSLRRPPWTQDKTARAMNANELILLPSISNWVAHAASRPEFFIIPRRKADLRLIKNTDRRKTNPLGINQHSTASEARNQFFIRFSPLLELNFFLVSHHTNSGAEKCKAAGSVTEIVFHTACACFIDIDSVEEDEDVKKKEPRAQDMDSRDSPETVLMPSVKLFINHFFPFFRLYKFWVCRCFEKNEMGKKGNRISCVIHVTVFTVSLPSSSSLAWSGQKKGKKIKHRKRIFYGELKY